MGAVLGGLYSLVILAPNLSFLVTYIGKFFCAMVIVFSVFGFHSISFFAKTVGVFFFSNLLFLGIILGLWMIFKPKGAVINNGLVYFGISAKVLIVTALFAYLITTLIIRIYNHTVSSKQIFYLTVFCGEKKLNLLAFSDSGNNLKEPFSDYPVIVADKNALCDFGKEKGVRLIPFETISGKGLLEGFKPDKVIIKANGKEKEITDVYVAYSSADFSKKDFSAILNPKILSMWGYCYVWKNSDVFQKTV